MPRDPFKAAASAREMRAPGVHRYPWPGDSSGPALSRGANASAQDWFDWHQRLIADPQARFRHDATRK